jgi:hypothetical protein
MSHLAERVSPLLKLIGKINRSSSLAAEHLKRRNTRRAGRRRLVVAHTDPNAGHDLMRKNL